MECENLISFTVCRQILEEINAFDEKNTQAQGTIDSNKIKVSFEVWIFDYN